MKNGIRLVRPQRPISHQSHTLDHRQSPRPASFRPARFSPLNHLLRCTSSSRWHKKNLQGWTGRFRMMSTLRNPLDLGTAGYFSSVITFAAVIISFKFPTLLPCLRFGAQPSAPASSCSGRGPPVGHPVYHTCYMKAFSMCKLSTSS